MCEECRGHCLKGTDSPSEFKHVWPAFLWNTLCGTFEDEFGTHRFTCDEVSGGGLTLWRIVPESMRLWWLDEVRTFYRGSEYPFAECTTEYPSSIFVDRTVELRQFREDVSSTNMARFKAALNNEEVMLPRVLCPFGCTEYCHEAKRVHLDLIIQRFLIEVPLKLLSDRRGNRGDHYSKYHDMCPWYFCEEERRDAVLHNRRWTIAGTALLDPDNGLCLLSCRNHGGGDAHLRLYPPRQPHGINLSARKPDQLSHVSIVSRTLQQSIRRGVYNTTWAMSHVRGTYSGIDTGNITTVSDFSEYSLLRSLHEAVSLRGRPDLQTLLSKKLSYDQINRELADGMLDDSYDFDEVDIQRAREGATYVPYLDTVRIHLHQADDDKSGGLIDAVNASDKVVQIKRQWPRVINIVQSEDSDGYGYQFRPIPAFNELDKETMMLWSLYSLLSGVKELWQAVDSKCLSWHCKDWEGHVLTQIRHDVFSYLSGCYRSQGISPFKPLDTIEQIAEKVNDSGRNHQSLTVGRRFDGDEIAHELKGEFGMSFERLHELFYPDEHPTIAVHDSVEAALEMEDCDSKDVILVHTDTIPEEFTQTDNGDGTISLTDGRGREHLFELRSIVFISTEYPIHRESYMTKHPGKYNAVRYIRHGNGYNRWWKAGRAHRVVTKCSYNPIDRLKSMAEDYSECFCACILAFVKKDTQFTHQWRDRIFDSMGGNSSIKCACSSLPLIPSRKAPDKKMKCKRPQCKRKESYVCCIAQCNTRLCKTCYKSLPSNEAVEISPDEQQDHLFSSRGRRRSNRGSNDDEEDGEEDEVEDAAEDADSLVEPHEIRFDDHDDGVGDDAEEGGVEGDSHNPDEGHERFDDVGRDVGLDDDPRFEEGFVSADAMENHLTYQDLDPTYPLTSDNIDTDAGFLSTNAGDMPLVVEQDTQREQVSGCVLLNQAAVCTMRYGNRIPGTQKEKNFIQRMCATSPNESCPILSIDSVLFPRIFWSSATHDRHAVLGAMPIWTLSSSGSHGFSKVIDVIRTRLTTLGSLTSVQSEYVKEQFCIMANHSLSNGDSRTIMKNGFQCDKKRTGLEARNGNGGLTESVDSSNLVRGLSASQEHFDWCWFITITPNQSCTPGLSFIHEWVRSDDWRGLFRETNYLSDWHDMDEFEQAEFTAAMDEASGPIFFRNWQQANALIVDFIRHKMDSLGNKVAIFNRQEYQTKAGNLPHDHMVLALHKDTTEEEKEALLDTIRTAAVEVIPSSDIERLMEEGLIKDIAEYHELIARALKLLKHSCNDRCMRRVNHTGDPEVDFKCRKPHNVFDSPDVTRHCAVRIPVKLSEHASDILVAIEEAHRLEDGEYEYYLPFFNQVRMMPKANANETCNISPVTTDFHLLTESMGNCQWIGHGRGCTKYILKYSAKVDESNRVNASVNAHTGVAKVGLEFIHNSKIESSNYHEKKALESRRDRNHASLREMPILEMLHSLLAYPEISTDVVFVEISTLPLELRLKSRVKLKENGETGVDEGEVAGADAHYSRNFTFSDAARCRTSGLLLHQTPLPYQNMIALDNKVCTRINDRVSQFSVRPPELLPVVENICQYFRLFYINEKQHDIDEIMLSISGNLAECGWFDNFNRRVFIRANAVKEGEIQALLEGNLAELRDPSRRTNLSPEKRAFAININETVQHIVMQYEASLESSDVPDEYFDEFIFDDLEENLPVPVTTNVDPKNTTTFLNHICLSLGKFETEMDVFQSNQPREMLRRARLIGDDEDAESLEKYCNDLMRMYLRRQLCFYANSIRKTDIYIINAYRLLRTVIVQNAFPLFDNPCLMSQIQMNMEEKAAQTWPDIKNRVLAAYRAHVGSPPNFPTVEAVAAANHLNPISWDPSELLTLAEGQSEESLAEQKFALSVMKRTIDRYTGLFETFTKCKLIHGAPGCGKSFLGSIAMFYAISQGLRVIPTAVMAARATGLGGIHTAVLMGWGVPKSSARPYSVAEASLQTIMRDPIRKHLLLTADVIFFDEAAQESADRLATADIILRYLRKSQTPFGGVLILGSMDHAQIQPIKAMPFLLSSLVITTMDMIELRHSVRASSDPDFQRFQKILRMNPYTLAASSELKEEFMALMDKPHDEGGINFVSSWDDPSITPNTVKIFAKREMVKKAQAEHASVLVRKLEESGQPFLSRVAVDKQVRAGARSEYSDATAETTKFLNVKLREPERLVLHKWGLYEMTINDKDAGYCYSQLALLVDTPDMEVVDQFGAFKVWLVPGSANDLTFLDDDQEKPTKEQLLAMGYREVRVGFCPDRIHTLRGGVQAKRQQYALSHLGAFTVNKVQGLTIYTPIAIECTSTANTLWEQPQAVVFFSRTKKFSDVTIVGNREFVKDHIWKIITTPTQWTNHLERILNMVTLNRDPDAMQQPLMYDAPSYPFSIRDAVLPSDSTGFVYILVSLVDPTFTYIGETQNIVQRLINHQSGHGAIGTATPGLRPFAVAGYICGLGNYTELQRKGLENNWRIYRDQLQIDDPYLIIQQGNRVAQDENAAARARDIHDQVNFVCFAQRSDAVPR